MFFFCKPKTIVLDVFTTDQHLIDMLPPDYADKFKPSWWNDIEDYTDYIGPGIAIQGNTMKRCVGFKNYYSDRAIVVPLWASFILEYATDGSRHVVSNPDYGMEFQKPTQRGSKYVNDYHHFKLSSPWKFKEKSGINFLFSQAFYNFKDPAELILPPAVLNYRHQHGVLVNFFVKKPKEGETARLELSAGQPLIHLTPLSEKKVLIKPHLISKEEHDELQMPSLFFNGIYSKCKKLGYGK